MKSSKFVLLVVASLLASGCSHTVQGVQQDANDNAPVAKAAVQQADQALDTAGQATAIAVKKADINLAKFDHDASFALLAPEIKADIIADKDFDAKQNSITVNSSAQGVYLRGHVTSRVLRVKADQIASSVIAKRNLSVPLRNDIAVNPG